MLLLTVWLLELYHISGSKRMATFHLPQRGLIPIDLYYIMSYHQIMAVINVWLLMNMAGIIPLVLHLLLKVLANHYYILIILYT